MLNEMRNEMLRAAFVRKFCRRPIGELVHLLAPGSMRRISAALAPEEKDAVSALDGMRSMTDGIADGLRDGEWRRRSRAGTRRLDREPPRPAGRIRSAIRADDRA